MRKSDQVLIHLLSHAGCPALVIHKDFHIRRSDEEILVFWIWTTSKFKLTNYLPSCIMSNTSLNFVLIKSFLRMLTCVRFEIDVLLYTETPPHQLSEKLFQLPVLCSILMAECSYNHGHMTLGSTQGMHKTGRLQSKKEGDINCKNWRTLRLVLSNQRSLWNQVMSYENPQFEIAQSLIQVTIIKPVK